MDPASCLHSLLPPPRPTAITSKHFLKSIRVYQAQLFLHTIWSLATTSKPTFLPFSLFVLFLATLYNHLFMCVGLFVHFSAVLHVLMLFSCFCVLCRPTDCVVVFYEWHCILLIHWLIYWLYFIDLFSCTAASMFNKLTYLLTLLM